MTTSRARRLRHAAAGFALLALATGPAHAEKTLSDYLPDDLETTLSGSYLAALSATRAADVDAATLFFEDALSQDPDNPMLLDRTFSMLLVNGRIQESLPIAERLILSSDSNRMGQIVLGIEALKAKNYRESSTRLAKGDRGPLANVTASLLAAWAAQGQNETDAALKIVDTMNGPEWYGTFKNFNMALIADVAGRQDEALASIEKAYQTDSASMRVVEAYARLKARAGKKDEALKALDTFAKSSAAQPLIQKLADEIKAGKTPAPLITTVQQGAAEVLYGIGAALSTEKGGDELGTVYLQLGRYLDPKSDLITMALGDLLQGAQQFERSIAVFQQVPKASPLRRAADMQIAVDLDALGRSDDAIRQLKRLVAANPMDFEALTSLGTIYRGGKRFQESADMYSKAIAAIDPSDPRNWLLYYYRGVAYEQAGDWDKAEADLLQSLKLSPNEPQVLNYLGYSWIDKSINLDRGMAMIKKAVDLKPDDGYIVDSLGWAYYRTGHYDEAVSQLERAIALKSDDSTINDHLGDAYWKVGRKLEATFQWAHARDMNPEPAAKERILAKLAHGLDKVEESKVASATGNTVTDATMAAAPAPTTVPGSVTVGEGDSLWKIALRLYGNGELYQKLIEANRGKLRNPNRIVPGTVLEVPPAP
ncbi:Flp pilus assembly protein TadD, contains TPR repeats [Kaistia soli DSM 19436]|uniref:Flp pilus assembly protein TadD, contains TPR repeats n=1 Tax=Kaistia soli DSM 19436 TaxID=1122133 RepID=A0A1M4VQZ9_9HYPH|nr:tetratricopeptide repeat protein [Kaistia soli]SHE71232.1 Flp pilus assembly protein TadD, contains TPR repeats [Kaistia soli DSM 19436]